MKKLAPLSFCAMLLLAGCVIQSLNGFYTDESRCPMPGVVGKWQLVAQGGSEVKDKIKEWELAEGGITAYDEKGVKSKLETVYFKVADSVFVDCTAGAAEENSANIYWILNVMPVHTLCKVVLDKETLKFIPLDFKQMKKTYDEGKSGLKAVKAQSEADRIIFTSTSEEWIEFLKKNGSSKELFPEKTAYILKKNSGSEK
jgi:hypothetical protein